MMRFVCSCLLLFVLSSKSFAVIQVTTSDNKRQYLNPVKMSLVMHLQGGKGDWYWPACALFEENSAEVELLRKQIIQQIDDLMVGLPAGADRAITLSSLRRQIQSWNLAKRLPFIINHDLARLDSKYNPMFKEGNYLLRLVKRPKNIWISGFLFSPGSYVYKPQSTASGIVNDVHLQAEADNDFVYVISPQGKISKQNIAYWGKTFNQIMPGSQIFVPLSESLLDTRYESLNRMIAELAVHRVLQ